MRLIFKTKIDNIGYGRDLVDSVIRSGINTFFFENDGLNLKEFSEFLQLCKETHMGVYGVVINSSMPVTDIKKYAGMRPNQYISDEITKEQHSILSGIPGFRFAQKEGNVYEQLMEIVNLALIPVISGSLINFSIAKSFLKSLRLAVDTKATVENIKNCKPIVNDFIISDVHDTNVLYTLVTTNTGRVRR